MSLPRDRQTLVQQWNQGTRFSFYFFYGHRPPQDGVDASCLSQWFVRPFQVQGITYRTAEHWMMAEKARLFDDQPILHQILDCDTPKEAKALGRKVHNYDQEVWDKNKFEIVCQGNRHKFGQHPDLAAFLKTTILSNAPADSEPKVQRSSTESQAPATGQWAMVAESSAEYHTRNTSPAILVEAAGRDTIWGIGLGQSNPKAQDPNTWRGQNLLGFALTLIRDQG